MRVRSGMDRGGMSGKNKARQGRGEQVRKDGGG